MSQINMPEGSDGRPVMGQSVVPGSPTLHPSQASAALAVDSANFEQQISDTGFIVYRDQRELGEEGEHILQVYDTGKNYSGIVQSKENAKLRFEAYSLGSCSIKLYFFRDR